MSRQIVDEDVEFRKLERQYAGTIHLFRIEHLAARLDDGPVPVSWSSTGFTGNQVWLRLDTGERLRLKLLWPRRCTVAALIGIRWDPRIGWVVPVRTTAGERVVLYAWLAELHLPTRDD